MILLSEYESYYIHENTNTYIGYIREENIVDVYTFYDEISKALSFPDYFGKNLDALDEMLNDLRWIDCENIFLIIRENNSLSAVLKDDYEAIMEILDTVNNPKLTILWVK